MILEADVVDSQKPQENISYSPYHISQDQQSTLFIGKYQVFHSYTCFCALGRYQAALLITLRSV